MGKKRYVLRMREYGYDDEYNHFYDFLDDQKMVMAFEDEASADKAWKLLERKYLSDRNFSNIQEFCERSNEELLALDQFLRLKAGVNFVYLVPGLPRVHVDEGIEKSLAELEDDVMFEFLHEAGLCTFFVQVFDAEDVVYACYVPATNSYLIRDDFWQSGHDGIAISFTHDEEFLSICCDSYLKTRQYPFMLKGTLASLSDSPAILATVIAAKKGELTYDAEFGQLSIIGANALAALLPLLKQPPLEIRTLTLDELLAAQGVHIQPSDGSPTPATTLLKPPST